MKEFISYVLDDDDVSFLFSSSGCDSEKETVCICVIL